MQLEVKGKNVEVSDSIRSYAENKLRKLERQLSPPTVVELELTVERNPSISENQVAEATIWTKGPVLRAREASSDMKASIDQLTDKLARQVKRYREKRRGRATARRASRACLRGRGGRRAPDRQVQAVPGQAHEPRRGRAPARACRPRLLRVPERRVRGRQRRLPAQGRELRPDRAADHLVGPVPPREAA